MARSDLIKPPEEFPPAPEGVEVEDLESLGKSIEAAAGQFALTLTGQTQAQRRDRFAAAALTTLINRGCSPDEAAESAWKYADAMMRSTGALGLGAAESLALSA